MSDTNNESGGVKLRKVKKTIHNPFKVHTNTFTVVHDLVHDRQEYIPCEFEGVPIFRTVQHISRSWSNSSYADGKLISISNFLFLKKYQHSKMTD
jgi:hypothetical protein